MSKCKNAFKNIVIEPCFINDIGKADGEYKTVRRAIGVAWEKKDGEILVNLKTPANTNAEFIAKGKKIILDGKEYANKVTLTNGEFNLIVK